MSHSPLDWVGLYSPDRQHRLLAGLAGRNDRTRIELGELRQRLTEQEKRESEKLDLRHHETVGHCREQRREMLHRWDEAEERLTVAYETETVAIRDQISNLATHFRKKLGDEKGDIERKVAARCEAVAHQYENRRHGPSQVMRKEYAQIEEALRPIEQQIEWTRVLAIRRLDSLPEVAPRQSKATSADSSTSGDSAAGDLTLPTPTSVGEAIDAVATLSRHLKSTNAEMQSGMASKTVDSFYLPAGVAVFIVLWVIVVLMIRPADMLLWMIASVPIGGVIGFSIYGILLMPLRKMTRQIYPRCERLHQEANRCADAGRRVAKKAADELNAELIERHGAHLAAAKRWRVEQIEAAEKRVTQEHADAKATLEKRLTEIASEFTTEFNGVGARMRGDANTLAHEITETLSREEAENRARRAALVREREAELVRLEKRLRQGWVRGLRRIERAGDRMADRFPAWARVAAAPMSVDAELPCLPVGNLRIDGALRDSLDRAGGEGGIGGIGEGGGGDSDVGMDGPLPKHLPVVMHRRLHAGMIIQADPSRFDQAIDLAQAILWRSLCCVAAGRVKLTLIDPIGRGQNFASLMALTDHQPDMVGHRVWTGERQIEQRLDELAHRAEDILQVNLRDRFERIEQYNEIAGSMAEPYRVIAAIGMPESLSRDGYRSLRAIIDSGIRCGTWTILVCDSTKPWPGDMPIPDDPRMMRLGVDADGRWRHETAGFADLPLVPAESPPATMRPELVAKVGVAATQAARVEVPFAQIIGGAAKGDGASRAGVSTGNGDSHANGSGTGNGGPGVVVRLPEIGRDSSSGLEIPLGVQGAGRVQSLRLGEGVKQHVLIAGKTGSGKSSLLHTILTAGAAHYTPDQLHFYLLDFKKGVEFKIYADAPLPHARVIGIESEREFGRSVLQRLDAELQQRGEAFRAAGAQELSEYRSITGGTLPRVMLVVDEFQELFVRDDRLAADCAMLLDRMVRQGRSFGMHVVLSSQSLAGAHSLPRATLGQMAVRIAMQCSESDAAMILGDDNTAAKFISRPGEAIYNDAGGLLEGNQPFQVAYLNRDGHDAWLAEIACRDASGVADLSPRVVFEGNRPCRWTSELAAAAISTDASPTGKLVGLLGESVEIGPPAGIVLSRETGRNVMLVAPQESTAGLLASILSGFVASAKSLAKSSGAESSGAPPEIAFFDGSPVLQDSGQELGQGSLATWLAQSGLSAEVIKPRDCEAKIAELAARVRQRVEADQTDQPPVVVVIDPLNRFSDLRQDDSFSFSLDAAAGVSGSAALQSILRDGPGVGVFTILCCTSAETITRWLPRQSRHDLQQRILGRVNASDSAALIDSNEAAGLSPATMLIYDDSDGTYRKFRTCDLPDPADVRTWLDPGVK